MYRNTMTKMIAILLWCGGTLTNTQAQDTVMTHDIVRPGYLLVQGEVSHMLTLKASDLDTMTRVEAMVKEGDGPLKVYSGVALSVLLSKAGAPTGKQLQGKANMVKYLLCTAGDGYQVIFALPELDSNFASQVIFLADKADGKPITGTKGPFRVVVPGDKRRARWIYDVRILTVRTANNTP
jgi:hypothetical protein